MVDQQQSPQSGGGAPAPQPQQSSPFTDPKATQEYNRLIADGEEPSKAAGIVRNALYGVQHDWQAQGGDKGTIWGDGGPLGQSAENAVNQYRAWEKDRMPGCPPDFPYKGRNGQCAEKPDDCPDGMHVVGTPGKCVPNGPGEENLPKGPNSGGTEGQGQADPAKPVTNGNQLTMTGNPLQDMLIGQFNTGQDPSTYQNNIFALGNDMRPGGAGANLDATKSDRQAQSLSGGGLWWGQNKDTFGGFDASQKNAEPVAAAPAPAAAVDPSAGAPTQVGGVTAGNVASRSGGAHVGGPATKRNFGYANPAGVTPLAGMMTNQFGSPARKKPSYF
jgi:hypothetical protein